MRATIDYGIDLGTSNSAIAVQEGARPTLLGDADGRVLLPSAIRLRGDGTVEIGTGAHAARFTDPANTAVEFKRQMGTGERVSFPAAGRAHTPVELSAMVLRELARRARPGDQPLRAAVITIPAMFQLSQCEATRQAAALAGIEHAPLLQEPIAAAIAHAGAGHTREGHWLVYDLGGGTFDVSLVRSRAGRLQVLDHDGDNHLGGKDFNRLLARWAADLVRSDGKLGGFRRTDPERADAFARLAAEAERVRVRLSEVEQELFAVPDLGRGTDGEPVDISVPVDRGLIESLVGPSVLRTTALCKALLSRNQLKPSELKGVVLVGGPTRTPCVCAILERELGLPAAHAMDPTTIVAAGAAVFAATQKLPAALRPAGAALELEYEAMTTNPRPLLAGAVRLDGPADGVTARVVRDDGGYDSGPVAVGPRCTFTAALAVRKGELNVFTVTVSRGGTAVDVGPGRFAILHGLSVTKPPLAQSVGVMLADNSVRWYLRKGVVLPATNTVAQTTTAKLLRGQSGDAIRVPLVQGESERADRNQVIGVLCIHARDIARDLPAGTAVEVALSVDEFSRTTARAYVPLLDRWFDEVVRFDVEGKGAKEVSAGLTEQQNRLRQLELQADQLGDAGGDIDARIGEVEALIAEGDRDSVELADQMVRMMTRQIDTAEAGSRADKLREAFAVQVQTGGQVLKSPAQQGELAALAEEFNAALARNDIDAAQTKYDVARDLVFNARMQTPEFWRGLLGWLYERFDALGMLKLVEEHVQRGVRAAQQDDIGELVRVCNQLLAMLPSEERTQFEAVKSSVM